MGGVVSEAEQLDLALDVPPRPAAMIRADLDLFTPEELANALNVTPGTLEFWRCKGEGPDYVKPGKRVFYRRDDVRAWLNIRRQKPEKANG